MPKALPAQTESKPLANLRHEQLAQALARGFAPMEAYLSAYKRDFTPEQIEAWKTSAYPLRSAS